ncbi:MAG TPA: ABC transporter ATP-binding protein [Chloroflexota bacterium]
MPGESTPGSSLVLRDLLKRYGDTVAVDNLALDVAAGEFVTLLGPSGSGKTTTLNLIAGFTQPTSGQILVGGRDVSQIPAYRRNIGVVFQQYLLFPHMTVFQNVEFPLAQRRVPKPERSSRVTTALELVGLRTFANRYPRQLSGGQQQRVALARAIVFQPPLLLMDEPLGALDRKLREILQLEINRVHQEVGITFIYVTHDQEEALVLSDRIAIFNNGRIEQIGTARDVYERPASLFGARFIGDSNCFSGQLDAGNQEAWVVGETFRFRVHLAADCPVQSSRLATVLVRPEHVLIGPPSSVDADNILSGRVKQVIYLGSARRLEVEVAGLGTIVVRQSSNAGSMVGGDPVDVGWNARDSWVIPQAATV